MSDLDLAVIGNCSYGALIDKQARVVWACMPRFDSDPVFCNLLQNHTPPEAPGFYAIDLLDCVRSEQAYDRNTVVLRTRLYDSHGAGIEIVDFAPRFKLHGRNFRPTMLIRQVIPLSEQPRIRIRLRPAHSYGAGRPETTRGSNHIRYVMPDLTLRLTTDAPITYVLQETAFVLEEPITLVLGPDESLPQPPRHVGREFLEETTFYWHEWNRFLSIPFEWQEAVTRAAMTLKLCSFEESGAVIAAMTTSIPEYPASGRNWDYRFCWLRDAYFVVHALGRLSATRTMEEYMRYLTNIVAGAPNGHLQPVYGITQESVLTESNVDSLPGYRGMGPVRVGNSAYQQVQNDSYGAVILATTRSFFDSRMVRPGDQALFHRLEPLGDMAVRMHDQPDAGLWELRSRTRVHTFSSLVCWAGCDRLARIARQLGLAERATHWAEQAEKVRSVIMARAWNEKRNSFVESFEGDSLDASLLLMHEFGFIAADDPRFLGTLDAIEKHLRTGDHLFRYHEADDLGHPENAFVICTCWYIEALAAVGRDEEARELFTGLLHCRSAGGLLSEDLDPKTGELWGNLPQTYSMVGLINAAMRLSHDWEDFF